MKTAFTDFPDIVHGPNTNAALGSTNIAHVLIPISSSDYRLSCVFFFVDITWVESVCLRMILSQPMSI